MKTREKSSSKLSLDLIMAFSIAVYIIPLIKCTRDSIAASAGAVHTFAYIMAWFLFLIYPIAIVVVNHLPISGKRAIVNIVSGALLTYVLWRVIYMSVYGNDLMFFDGEIIGIVLFIIVFAPTPTLALVFNNR